MPLHLIKLAVGADSLADLREWTAERMAEARRRRAPLRHAHITRMAPKRAEQILDGGIYVSPQLELNKIFGPGQKSAPDDPLEMLSAREYQVFTLLVEGIRAKEIAARLELSPKTVDTYRASLMRKLDIHDVAGLVKFAIQKDLTSMSR